MTKYNHFRGGGNGMPPYKPSVLAPGSINQGNSAIAVQNNANQRQVGLGKIGGAATNPNGQIQVPPVTSVPAHSDNINNLTKLSATSNANSVYDKPNSTAGGGKKRHREKRKRKTKRKTIKRKMKRKTRRKIGRR